MTENKIYERVAATKHPFKLPAPWAHIRCANGFFRPMLDRARLLAELEDKFAREELLASGVAVLNTTAALDLAPALAHESALVFAARRSETAWPFDLVVEGHLARRLADRRRHFDNIGFSHCPCQRDRPPGRPTPHRAL